LSVNIFSIFNKKYTMKRLRVLISSPSFSPFQGSECAVGWNIVSRLALYHDVTVLCSEGSLIYPHPSDCREAYCKYINDNGEIAGLKVVFVKQPRTALLCAIIYQKLFKITKGFAWQILFYKALDAWHKEAFSVAQNIGFDKFDVTHQLTPVSFINPGYLWQSDLPFYWGPVGGMFKVPLKFAISQGINSFLFELMRNVNFEIKSSSRLFKSVVRKSEQIWTISSQDLSVVRHIDCNKGVPLLESAAPEVIKGFLRNFDGTRPLEIMWSGQHEPRKALPLLLYAMSKLSDIGKVYLSVLGTGPKTKNWKNLAESLSLNNINWYGRLSYEDAIQTMKNADVFVHTSFREATSLVLLEAMGWGLPVVCHDTCGMALAVDDTCGIKIPFLNPQESINGFYNGINKLLNDPQLVMKYSKGSLSRSLELSWDIKVKTIANAYKK